MTIPSYEEMMLPVLSFAGDKKEHTSDEFFEQIKKVFNITEEEASILLPSGKQSVVANRVGWARTYLKKAGLLVSQQRARFIVTERGLAVLDEKPEAITDKFLMKFPEFQEFQNRHKEKTESNVIPDEQTKTPLEMLEDGYSTLQSDLADELLVAIAKCSPRFFENLVMELLVGMGYGGSIADAGQTVGKTGDGGIDGIIKEDKLGLDVVYIQAKRWEGSVGSREIRNFVGALEGQRANKGVFITTSVFTQEAEAYVRQIQKRVILIDGQQLAQLMIDFNIGVSLEKSYLVKRVDHDFFEE